MALKTDSNRSECYDFAHGVLFSEPVTVFPMQNTDDCTIILDSCSDTYRNERIDLTAYTEKCVPYESKNFKTQHETCINGNSQVDEGLAVLEILHSSSTFCIPEDQPSYVDISEIKNLIESAKEESPPIVISDDDDVVFVDCVKENESEKRESKRKYVDNATRLDKKNIRRNPVRSARNRSKDFSKDILFEEDFAFLDTSEEETEEKENLIQEKKPPQVEKYKEWPVNVHERPEYNSGTKTIETFDYTIRDIQKKAPAPKKPRLETVIVKKKSKKKYGFTRRRSSRGNVEKKIPLNRIKTLVNETTVLLKEFFERTKESRELLKLESEKLSLENQLEILKNQVTLYAAVNEIEVTDVPDIFSGENSAITSS